VKTTVIRTKQDLAHWMVKRDIPSLIGATTAMQAVDYLDAYAVEVEAKTSLKYLQMWEHFLVAEIASTTEMMHHTNATRHVHFAAGYARAGLDTIEELDRKLGWVRGEMKRVSNLGKGRDPQENSQGDCSVVSAK